MRMSKGLWPSVLTLALLTAATASARPPARVVAPRLSDAQVASRLVPVAVGRTQIAGVVQNRQLFPQSVASGDPRPDSVVLWTRVADPDAVDTDVPVRVIVTQDRFFQNVVMNTVVMAKAAYDHCVKLKVTGLEPGTSYLYFFAYAKGGSIFLSQLGHTKTAPPVDADVPVRFAFFSCQDYEGKYYDTYAKLLLDHPDDIDFVVFLGDSIYETTGEPGFQTPTPERHIDFTDKAGAIQLGDEAHPYWAASSLSNYRQLYATYWTDPMLQRLHESFPMVAIWDDHEYANDSHGDVATYFDGRKDEADPVRRRHADEAFFEYMPVSMGLDAQGQLAIDDSILYPNAKIYQDFHFGKNIHLVLTDYRSFRPRTVIPEDAFPGTIVMDREVLEQVLGVDAYQAAAPSLDPYVNVDSDPTLRASLTGIFAAAYQQANPFFSPEQAMAKAQAVVAGNLSATYIDAAFQQAGLRPPFDETALALMDRGLSFLYLGKQELYSELGSRYFLVKDTFDLYSAYLYAITGGASEDVYGQEQEDWIKQTLSSSDATWKVFASSVSATSMVLDFTNPLIAAMLPPDFPDLYRTTFLLDADDWDGFPNRRRELMGFLQGVPGTVLISGDIHASFVGDHRNGVYEFTGTSVTAQTIGAEVLDMVMEDPLLSQVTGIDQLVGALDGILYISSQNPAVAASRVMYDETRPNGAVLVEADGQTLTATYYLVDPDDVLQDDYSDPATLDTIFRTVSFRVQDGQLAPLPQGP
jgi:alkaline phosphatase D